MKATLKLPANWQRLTQIVILFVLLLFPALSKAVVKSYNNTTAMQRNFKGYTVVQIPNSSNYLAFGTVYDPQVVYSLGGPFAGYDGLHCLKISSSGTLLNKYWFGTFASNPANVTSWWSYKVVDFTMYTNNRYWVTLQIRQKNPGAERDFFMCLEVDSTGTGISSRYFKFQGTNNPGNVYATHSLCYNNKIYVCGYTTGTATQYPSEPTTYSMRKESFIAVYNINPSFSVSFNSQLTWESGQGLYTDYDMALCMKLNSNNELFITGSANVGDNCPSGIMAMVIDPATLNIIYKKSYHPSSTYISPGYSYSAGYYGIDMWEDPVNGGYYILSNRFDGHGNLAWGVSHVDQNLKVSPGISYMEIRELPDEWADRVYEGPNGSHTIIGQQVRLHDQNYTIPLPNLQPGYGNVNPFFSNANWSYNPVTGGLGNSYNWHKIQPSTAGTQASIDYLTGNSTALNSLLEDVGRLYKHFAVQINNDPTQGFAMINPVVSLDAIHLSQKFVTIDVNADEQSCLQTYTDANPTFSTDQLLDLQWIVTTIFPSSPVWSAYQAANRTPVITIKDCNSGYYKTVNEPEDGHIEEQETGTPIAGLNILSQQNNNSIELYPNPAKEQITLHLDQVFGKGTFFLNDMTGKEIYRMENIESNSTIINLPKVAPGVYQAVIMSGGKQFVRKLSIY